MVNGLDICRINNLVLLRHRIGKVDKERGVVTDTIDYQRMKDKYKGPRLITLDESFINRCNVRYGRYSAVPADVAYGCSPKQVVSFYCSHPFSGA